MTGAWQRTNKVFFTNLGVAPKIVSWHAQAWRHQVNAPPFTLTDTRISFHTPVNKSEHFESGRKFTPLGSPFPMEISDISGIIFTQPTTARHFLFELFSDAFYICSEGDPVQVKTEGTRAFTPLSKAAFFAWWRSHQFHADAFLAEMALKHPAIPIFVTPSILPRTDQKTLPKAFRKFNFRMDRILLDILAEKYAVSCCTQPKETFDPETFQTLGEYAEPSPDVHHYSPAYVKSICATAAFQKFLSICS